jgi:aerobic-type carbon monoxide dehydrogenase small subunit (CoxS/CutS family)
MAEFKLNINQETYRVDVEADMPLLWVLRDNLGLTGTKYSCGMGLCGSCTVLIDGVPTRSCITPISRVGGSRITTIEGLSTDGAPDGGHPLQKAWLEAHVSQCGYCQPGQIMNAAALLEGNPNPSDEDIDKAMGDVLCRCGTYQRIRTAIHQAAKAAAASEAAIASKAAAASKASAATRKEA